MIKATTELSVIRQCDLLLYHMDGKGRWVENVLVEQLWRGVKYEDVYLWAYEAPAALRVGLTHDFHLKHCSKNMLAPIGF